MAEMCKDCWEKLYGVSGYSPVLSSKKDLDLCEGCGEYKRIVIRVRSQDEEMGMLLFYPFIIVYDFIKYIYYFIANIVKKSKENKKNNKENKKNNKE